MISTHRVTRRGKGDRHPLAQPRRLTAIVAARLDQMPTWLSAAYVGLALFVVYLPTASYTWQQSPDPLAALIPAWQVVNHGTLAVDAYEGLVPWFKEFDGRIVSDRAPGVVFFGVPFYWLLRGLGQSPVPAALAAATSAASAMAVLHVVFRRHVSPATATVATLLAGVGTATWTVSADGLWAHGPAQLWLALALLAAPKRMWASGLLLGLAILTRPQLAVAAAVFGLVLAASSRSPRRLLQAGVGSACGAVALVAYNAVAFGSPSLTGGYEDLAVRHLTQLTLGEYGLAVVGTLVSPDRGVLVLSPFLLLVACGIPRAWRSSPPDVRAGAAAGLAYICAYLLMNRFSGGENFFSYRLPLESLVLAAPLLLIAFERWVRPRAWAATAFWVLSVSAVAVHALGALFYSPSYIDHGPWRGARVAEALSQAGPGRVLLGVTLAIAVAVLGAWRVHLAVRRGRGEPSQGT